MAQQDYAQPGRLCDLVMKGGITSGIIYPLAVTELAQAYSFKSIGGTSAGAIAAAAAAAAECGRRNGTGDGFEGLAALPGWLGAKDRLVNMFRPDPSTARLFHSAISLARVKGTARKTVAAAGVLIRRFPFWTILGALPGSLLGYVLFADLSGWKWFAAATGATILAMVGAMIAVLFRVYSDLTQAIPKNFYGLSKAFDANSNHTEAPLTNWLTGLLNRLAGKPLTNGPLTFGDLYNAPALAVDHTIPDPPERAINLEMMTTNVNHGRPYRLPFRDPDKLFYFLEADFRQLFPGIVVDHMVKNPGQGKEPWPRTREGRKLIPFPDAADLPVVVATRMSLSFPILLAAVPLYAVDFTRKVNQQAETRFAERCWFSDGGICSNLPIHFFDSPVPRWPTFAINLKQFHPDHPSEEDAVWLPKTNRSGMLVAWTRFEVNGAFGRPSQFLAAILNTMQNWQDNLLARMPGYRDRLVHVSQRADEGGLNLNMTKEAIDRLGNRGKRAAAMLMTKFGGSEPPISSDGWNEHRWVRFRSTMALTERWLVDLTRGFTRPVTTDTKLEEQLARSPNTPPDSYRFSQNDQPVAQHTMQEITELSAQMSEDGDIFQEDAPRPSPELRIRPRF